MINTHKWVQLRHKMSLLQIHESDLEEGFIIGSGRGGQKKHKTASCVALKHIPTGISIKCEDDRMRENNRFLARRRLCKKIETLRFAVESEAQQVIAKLRRQKKRRTRRAKAKMQQDKTHQSHVKTNRKPPPIELD